MARYAHGRGCAPFRISLPKEELVLLTLEAMSSSGGWSGSPSSWSVAAVGVLAGLGAGYALGAASNGWLEARRRRPPPASSSQVAVEVSGNLVAALVELTAEVEVPS